MAAVLEAPTIRKKLVSESAAPPLEQGDRLTTAEFMRRFEGMPELKKAELIRGIVFMGSPVSFYHGEPDQFAQTVIGAYALQTPGLSTAANTTVRFDGENVAQPDLLLRICPKYGGRCKAGEDGYFEGPPDLVIEIATTTTSMDLHWKLELYQRAGVREYIVWRTLDNAIDWFYLENDQYLRMTPDTAGIARSRNFPGLCLDIPALLALDGSKALASLNAEMKTEAYANFVASLQAKVKPATI